MCVSEIGVCVCVRDWCACQRLVKGERQNHIWQATEDIKKKNHAGSVKPVPTLNKDKEPLWYWEL